MNLTPTTDKERTPTRPAATQVEREERTRLSGLHELESRQAAILTEDPARFLVAQTVLLGNVKTLSGLRDYFSGQPELEPVVDSVVVALENRGLLAIDGDEIELVREKFSLADEPRQLAKFLPNLMKVATKRILEDSAAGIHIGKREAVHYFALPEDPVVSRKARDLYLEYLGKMRGLLAETEVSSGSATRYVAMMNGILEPEDFV